MINPQKLIMCYIINKINDDKIVFQALPEDITENYGANWENTDIRGRSAPYLGYSGNEARTVSYSVKLHDDICDDLMDMSRKFKALVYPRYSGSIVTPPYCRVKFGSMVSMLAVVNSVSFTWSGPILDGSDHFSTLEVSLEFTELITGAIPSVKTFD